MIMRAITKNGDEIMNVMEIDNFGRTKDGKFNSATQFIFDQFIEDSVNHDNLTLEIEFHIFDPNLLFKKDK